MKLVITNSEVQVGIYRASHADFTADYGSASHHHSLYPSHARRCAHRINKGFPHPPQALPRSVISTAFSRVEGLVSWKPYPAPRTTQPAVGMLPVLGELTLGAASGKEHKHVYLAIITALPTLLTKQTARQEAAQQAAAEAARQAAPSSTAHDDTTQR